VDNYDTLEYSRVKAIAVSVRLRIFLCTLINTNKLFGAVAGEAIGVKILIMILMSANSLYPSFSRITPVLLNCGIDRTSVAVSTFRQTSTR
jgi:hypothetical protein